MSRIVCATRGGAASRRVQEEAIGLAKELGAELTFLFVSDVEACAVGTGRLVDVIREELERLGRSLLHIAHVRATEQGVASEMVSRCGPVRQSILDFVGEIQADMLVIGAPRTVSGIQEFGDEGIKAFAEDVTQRTGVKVVIA
jgi:nucleotide-binding universal stress UspA family protein